MSANILPSHEELKNNPGLITASSRDCSLGGCEWYLYPGEGSTVYTLDTKTDKIVDGMPRSVFRALVLGVGYGDVDSELNNPPEYSGFVSAETNDVAAGMEAGDFDGIADITYRHRAAYADINPFDDRGIFDAKHVIGVMAIIDREIAYDNAGQPINQQYASV